MMSFAEKLKAARKEAGLSQEQLAEKLCVSRSAVAKWETGSGMPDVDNLRALSSLLNTSLDNLLASDEDFSFAETKEPIDLDSFEKTGRCRDKKDAAVFARDRDADAIYPLLRKKKLNGKEFLLDLATMWGASRLADWANNPDAYYLIEKGNRQYLARVSKEFITTVELPSRVDPKKFSVGVYEFRKAAYRLI